MVLYFQMMGDDNSCQEIVGTKSDEHRACEKQFNEDEVVVLVLYLQGM